MPSARVGIFYYPWFATPRTDGRYAHWQQGSSTPPANLASGFYPARGLYSSADALVVDAQMGEIAAAGIGTVIVFLVGERVGGRQAATAGGRGREGARALGRRARRAVRGQNGRVHRAGHRLPAHVRRDRLLHLGFGRAAGRGVGGVERPPLRRAHVREHEPRGPRRRRQVRRALHLRRPPVRRRALPAPLRPGAARSDCSAPRRSGRATTPGVPRATPACGHGGTARPTTRCGAAR